eukprot:273828-Rhodomonas_salina.2
MGNGAGTFQGRRSRSALLCRHHQGSLALVSSIFAVRSLSGIRSALSGRCAIFCTDEESAATSGTTCSTLTDTWSSCKPTRLQTLLSSHARSM